MDKESVKTIRVLLGYMIYLLAVETVELDKITNELLTEISGKIELCGSKHHSGESTDDIEN